MSSRDRHPLVHCPPLYDIRPGGDMIVGAVIYQEHIWRQRLNRRDSNNSLDDDGYYCVRCLSRITVEGNLEYTTHAQ